MKRVGTAQLRLRSNERLRATTAAVDVAAEEATPAAELADSIAAEAAEERAAEVAPRIVAPSSVSADAGAGRIGTPGSSAAAPARRGAARRCAIDAATEPPSASGPW